MTVCQCVFCFSMLSGRIILVIVGFDPRQRITFTFHVFNPFYFSTGPYRSFSIFFSKSIPILLYSLFQVLLYLLLIHKILIVFLVIFPIFIVTCICSFHFVVVAYAIYLIFINFFVESGNPRLIFFHVTGTSNIFP